jgi:hypothetical protein
MIQTLGLTLGGEQAVWVVLDSLRKKEISTIALAI